MSKPVWKFGPPPSLGWWPASHFCDANIFRWWDGASWSYHAREGYSLQDVAHAVRNKEHKDSVQWLMWTDRPKSWPARSKT